ncbi:hypothetical protein VR010_08150 [Actinomycetaceae bacterium L2_0104]
MDWNVKVLLSIVISALLVALAVWTGFMYLSPHLGQQAYRDGRYAAAERHYSTAMRATPDAWEGWRAPFNRGTSRLHMGVDAEAGGLDGGPGTGYSTIADAGIIDRAVTDLELALERVPEAERVDGQVADPDEQPECQVRRNLSIGQELQGDAKVGAGDQEGAAAAYALAQETLAPCQESEKNQDQSERQEQKEQENNQDDGGGDGGGGEEPDNGGGDGGEEPDGDGGNGGQETDPENQGKEDELEERNQRGQEEYDEQEGDGYGGGVNW